MMVGVQAMLEYILLLMSWSQPEMLCAKLQQRDILLEEYGNEAN